MYRKSCTIQLCTCMLVMMLMACMNSVYMFLHVRLFSLSIKDYSSKAGVAVFPSVVLDTITTLNAEAFAINRESGLGSSPVRGSADGQEGPVCVSGAAVQHQLSRDCHCHSSSLLLWHQQLCHCKHPDMYIYTVLHSCRYLHVHTYAVCTCTGIIIRLAKEHSKFSMHTHTHHL